MNPPSRLLHCHLFICFFCMHSTSSPAHTTPTHDGSSWPLTAAGLSIMISPVKCDPAATEPRTAVCCGHGEFQVSSDKWPRLAVDQETRGLSDLSLQQQTLLQPLGLSAGCCALSLSVPPLTQLIRYSHSVSPLLFPLITVTSKPESKMLHRRGSSKINNKATLKKGEEDRTQA